MLIPITELEKSEAALPISNARKAKATISFAHELAEVIPGLTSERNITGDSENMTNRKAMLAVVAPEPVDFALERAIGKNDSVYSNFVDLLSMAKEKVGRVVVKKGNENKAFGTGFMVSDKLMLTNWHVLSTKETAGNSEIHFFYELDLDGNPGDEVCFKLRPDIFYYSFDKLDYCFVAVDDTDINGDFTLDKIGYLFLDPSLGKLGNEEEESLNIIHHPDGDYKQLSIRENLFDGITETTIFYKTDTAPGSSGSPVFNDQWQVVALHHSGIAKKNANGQYIDKQGEVIPLQDNKIDAARVVWEKNEGVRISVILNDVISKFSDNALINALSKKPARKTRRETPCLDEKSPDNTPNKPHMENNNSTNVNISFPASLIEGNKIVEFTIGQTSGAQPVSSKQVLPPAADEELLLEVKQLEDGYDYSKCNGYQKDFLGPKYSIPIPTPKKELEKFIAKITGTSSYVLKYYNFSAIQHSVRKMPVISAVNIEGSSDLRQDNSDRKDVWIRDKRIAYSVQLDNVYYKSTGFDRGHMSRREDANWGKNADEAKRNADLTCIHTNACPQVPKLNRSSSKGLWGILEKVVLEEGAFKENGKTARITVFNGPIFKDSDPVLRGVQIPVDFYKIVLWLTDNGALKATGFKLSQSELVASMDLEELNLDKNVQFKEYLCSIKELEELTKIDFSALYAYDTFTGNSAAELADETAVAEHIKSNK